MSNELIDGQLSGKNTYQRHVILHADGIAACELVNQFGNSGGVENAITRDLCRGQQIDHIVESRTRKETISVGGAVGLLGATDDIRRNQVAEGALEDIFLVQHFHLVSRRQLGAEFDNTIVKEWMTSFDGVSQSYPVSLGRQNITREQKHGF